MSFLAPTRLTIATRQSRLAMWQAEHIRDRLLQLYPTCDVQLLPMTTQGDELLNVTLASVGGKGLFIKELEHALQDGRADLAVHSMKDMPVDLPTGFCLAAITEREDPRDAFVSTHSSTLDALPVGAVVGTASLRRACQLAVRYPHLVIRPVRGNLDTRLKKLDDGDYAALILAAAGLTRLGLAARIRYALPSAVSLPAAGQGALGIECLQAREDLRAVLQPLEHPPTALCVRAERAVNRALGGDCSIPLAAFAELGGASLRLRALVGSPDGKRMARSDVQGPMGLPEELGARAGAELRAAGAEQILAALKT